MMLEAVISNADHPEYGVATIPFPIPKEQYDQCIEMVKALEIGDPFKKDCKVMAIDSFYSVLKITENLCVNLDELDYLAKRLESFDVGEAAQFQAMASKLELFELKDLINLTFCCQQATVITDFSDLEAIGRDHYMNLNGGGASVQELEDLDGVETAILLIDAGGGTITRYGVVYDNGMKMDQSYDGKHFPAYLYEPCMLMVALTSQKEPENTENITWLYLPAAKGQIERAMERSGIEMPTDMRFRFGDSMLPVEVDAALDFKYECPRAASSLPRPAYTPCRCSSDSFWIGVSVLKSHTRCRKRCSVPWPTLRRMRWNLPYRADSHDRKNRLNPPSRKKRRQMNRKMLWKLRSTRIPRNPAKFVPDRRCLPCLTLRTSISRT